MDWPSKKAFSSNEYTKNILKGYSTKNKVHRVDDELIDICVYTAAYVIMDKSTRVSIMVYKIKGTKLLKTLHIKCASVDFNTELRAKMASIICRISHEETSLNFLTRLEQNANYVCTYDMKKVKTEIDIGSLK